MSFNIHEHLVDWWQLCIDSIIFIFAPPRDYFRPNQGNKPDNSPIRGDVWYDRGDCRRWRRVSKNLHIWFLTLTESQSQVFVNECLWYQRHFLLLTSQIQIPSKHLLAFLVPWCLKRHQFSIIFWSFHQIWWAGAAALLEFEIKSNLQTFSQLEKINHTGQACINFHKIFRLFGVLAQWPNVSSIYKKICNVNIVPQEITLFSKLKKSYILECGFHIVDASL